MPKVSRQLSKREAKVNEKKSHKGSGCSYASQLVALLPMNYRLLSSPPGCEMITIPLLLQMMKVQLR